MNINVLFPKRFLSGDEVQGKSYTLTIQEVTMETMGKEQESHPVVWFRGAKKGVVLKKTNAIAIASLYGPDTDTWGGAVVRLSAKQIRVGGVMTWSLVLTPVRVVDTMPVDDASPPDTDEDE